MVSSEIFFLVIAVIIFIVTLIMCFKGCTNRTWKDCCSIWCRCLRSVGDCAWCKRRLSSDTQDSANHYSSGADGIRTVGEDNPGIYNVSFEPPSYESVTSGIKDPELPSYEEAMNLHVVVRDNT